MLVLLKLGGSLITNKHVAQTARGDVITRLAEEIAAARQEQPDLRLVIGHGSGSFGHIPARQYGTRQGVHSPEEWAGFAQVWQAARALNQIVLEAFVQAGLPVVAFPPSAAVLAVDGRPAEWSLEPLKSALKHGLIPLVNGDAVFDRVRGGTILSTELLFEYLAPYLKPDRILLAGIEPGVWADFPTCTRLVERITPVNSPSVSGNLTGSTAPDVTGGMAEKVNGMLALVQQSPGLQALIFSAEQAGQLYRALSGDETGTCIAAS
jgi:isopentenyl phosphate kinase